MRTRLTVARPLALALALALALGLAACGRGAGGQGPGSGGGGGTGATGGTGAEAADCEAARAHVSQLYRADAGEQHAGKEPAVIDGIVADNTAMVMTECTRDPGRVARCAGAARSAAELERTCLAPLDDEGTEGDRFKSR
jgi:hypothetical protein